ncbi:hypothetical protein OQA88_12350 [Cercophora sp. LCS_1]
MTPPADASINTTDGLAYWESVSADENGMLGGIPSIGGFAYISKVDLQGSRNFLAKLGIGLKPPHRGVNSALEGGAGIGRITRGLLLPFTPQVDIIEPIAKFTASIAPQVRRVFNIGLESWVPDPSDIKYDLIWIQWCVGHLTDSQLVSFLERCKSALDADREGVIVLKENLSTSGEDVFDEEDSSVTREDGKFLKLFEAAGLEVVRMEVQRGFPVTSAMRLLPVKMYALRGER